jgi:hypothetical protein
MAGERLPERFSLRNQLWFPGERKVLRNHHKPYANRYWLLLTKTFKQETYDKNINKSDIVNKWNYGFYI